jgi:2,3-bisphosphoglycerate-independent phosphoglycerate mutase
VFPDSQVQSGSSRILLCVLDGLGDIPGPDGLATPLEAAHTPHLDALAREGTSGLFEPVAAGITPGSGPGHLALFGYPPADYPIGRGVLSALGIDFPLKDGDIAARFNFCTLDQNGLIVDRRAGRLPTEINQSLVSKLRNQVKAPAGVELFWDTESEHRGLLVVRGGNLDASLTDTDPQTVGQKPLDVEPLREGAEAAALLMNGVLADAYRVLVDEPKANGILLRGFASLPDWALVGERYRLKAHALTKYPMYRGVARLVGMATAEPYDELEEVPGRVQSIWSGAEFMFVHFKDPDKAGEDGNYLRKQKAIERFDAIVPQLRKLNPDVLVVTGDHSTPVAMLQHSWHPVPVVLWAPATVLPDLVEHFGERPAMAGGLGQRPMCQLMSLMLAHAGRLAKFGA